MFCKFGFVFACVGACFTACAHDVITTKVTWSREISRLVYKRCASCHREGGSAFSLMTYEGARPWAKAIKEETLERRMPPWGAVKGFGSFKDDQGLTQEELEVISDWVEGGSPEGDPARLPRAPEFHPSHPLKTGPELIVDGSLTLKQATTLSEIHAKAVLESQSIQIIAERPDGTVEPLLWLYNYKPQFDHAYYFKTPMSLAAGTKIVSSQPGSIFALGVSVPQLRASKHK